jgi:hypothetical protein
MRNPMTVVATALFALSTSLAFAAEPAKKEESAKPAVAKPAAKAASAAADKAAGKAADKAEPAKKKEKKGGC